MPKQSKAGKSIRVSAGEGQPARRETWLGSEKRCDALFKRTT